jgi:hypothetical protein
LGAADVDQRKSVGFELASVKEVDVVGAEPLLVFVNVPGNLDLENLETGKVVEDLRDGLSKEVESDPVAGGETPSVHGGGQPLHDGRVEWQSNGVGPHEQEFVGCRELLHATELLRLQTQSLII